MALYARSVASNGFGQQLISQLIRRLGHELLWHRAAKVRFACAVEGFREGAAGALAMA